MAIGDVKISVNFARKSLDGDYSPASTYKYVLTSATFASINANTVTGISGLTGVLASAGSYVNGTTITGVTLTAAANVVTFDSHNIDIGASPSNPTTARTLVMYSDSPVNGSQIAATDVIAVFDLTTDGSTAINLENGMTLNMNAAGIYSVTVNA